MECSMEYQQPEPMADLEEPQPPLILCMDSVSGEEVTLKIDPGDNFQTFLDKARSLLGYDIDLNSIIKNQPISLTDNVYDFLINMEQSMIKDAEFQGQDFEELLDASQANDDLVYIFDDGTQIRASQIHFDNEDPLVDISVEQIPFVKYINDGLDDVEPEFIGDNKIYNIAKSPAPKPSGKASPHHAFANTLPFRLVSNNTLAFEAQFNKYLESNSKNLTNVSHRSPRSLIRDSYEIYEEKGHNADDFSHYTREEILDMFKDSPVASLPYDKQCLTDKRRHVRKTDPSRLYKSWNAKPIQTIDVNGMLISDSESKNCFVCNKHVDNAFDKLYFFDNEDQRQHRSSPQKTLSNKLKIICEYCLDSNFKPCRLKSPNQSLNADEFLVIRNNQQYIFQKKNNIDFKTVNFKSLEAKASREAVFKEKTEFLKLEIGSDGEIVTQPLDNVSDDVIIVKDERIEQRSSSDVEIIENEPEIDDNIIDNLEEADDDVIEFLGKYQCESNEIKELKCRFCEKVFPEVLHVIEHGETHKHVVEDGDLYPCPLCDYGYANFKWLKGHLIAAHSKLTPKAEAQENDKENDKEEPRQEEGKGDAETEVTSPNASPIAKRTRSAVKKSDGDSRDPNTTELVKAEGIPADFEIKLEVKQECIASSDDEIWIVQTADDEGEEQLQQILEAAKKEKKHEKLKKVKCDLCNQLFMPSEGLVSHKCKRAKKRDSVIRVPTKEDFIKRARGRQKLEDTDSRDDNADLLVVRGPKKSTKEPTSDPQIVTCHDCNESFTSKVRLKFHMHFHTRTSMLTRDGQYKCIECDSALFATETELFDHVHFQHKQKRWQCPVKGCGKTFYLRATLTKHSRSHTDTRRYACTTCGKRFLDKQTLDEHGVTHLQIKPFQCHICLKQLTRRSRLRMHLRAHEEELRPRLVIVCAVCGRAFRGADDVQEHITRSPDCIEEIANEVKEEVGTVSVHLSPTSGLVRHTVRIAESPKLSRALPCERNGAAAEALLSRLGDAARSVARVVEIEKAFRCEYCEDVFYSEDGLNNHRAIHKGIKNPFTCHICKVSFATYSRCTTHKTTHGFYKRSLADAKKQAGKTPIQQGPSAIGILGYGDFPVVKHFLCEDCGRSYLHWTYLQVHRRMKHAAENYKYNCNQCEQTFANSWSVTYHKKKMHSKNGPGDGAGAPNKSKEDYRIPCRDCDEVLPNKTALYKHRKKEHSDGALRVNNKPGVAGLFCCGACDRQYGSRAGLEAHALSHTSGIATTAAAANAPGIVTGARVSACAKCGHSFPGVTELHAHLKEAHGQESDFTCSLCSKTFTSLAEVSVHSRQHTTANAAAASGDVAGQCRPHRCPAPECERAFRTPAARDEHLRVHTGERPYPCDVCGTAFRRSTAMRNHRLIHTGVRAWACAHCPKRFRIKSDLRTHLRLKHPTSLAVIEVPGLSPAPEEVMERLAMNGIPQDRVVEITKMSFTKGTTSVIPHCVSGLCALAHIPRTQVACGRQRGASHTHTPFDMYQPARRGRGIAKNPRRLNPIGSVAPPEAGAHEVGAPEAIGAHNAQGLYQISLSVPAGANTDGGNQQDNQVMYPVTLTLAPEHLMENGQQQESIAYPLNITSEELTELNMQLLLREELPNGNQMVRLGDTMLE